MTAPQTPDREQEIRARASAATRGPWGTYDDGTGLIDIAADLTDTGHGYQCRRYIGQLESDQIDNDPAHADWDEDEDREQEEADAAFIVHAREDIPWLLARVAELEADRDSAVAAAVRRALEDFASRLTARAASMGAEYFRVDQVAKAARKIAAEEHAAPSPAREQGEDDVLADLIARCPEHGTRTETWPECRCAAARKAVAAMRPTPEATR